MKFRTFSSGGTRDQSTPQHVISTTILNPRLIGLSGRNSYTVPSPSQLRQLDFLAVGRCLSCVPRADSILELSFDVEDLVQFRIQNKVEVTLGIYGQKTSDIQPYTQSLTVQKLSGIIKASIL